MVKVTVGTTEYSVEEGTLHGEVCLHGSIDFTGRNQVNGHALFCHNLVNALEASCLAGKQRIATPTQCFLHSVQIDAAVITDAVFIHQIRRCAILLCKVYSILAGKGQMSGFIDTNIVTYHS